MSDLICRKSMTRCQTPGMCSPHGGCRDEVTTAKDRQISALIAENERLQGCEDVLRQLASHVGAGGYNAPEVDPETFARKIMDGINILNDPLAQLVIKKGEQIDQLRAEVAGLRTGYEAYERVNAELKAENEALRGAGAGALRFVAFAFDEGVEGAELAGRAIEDAIGAKS